MTMDDATAALAPPPPSLKAMRYQEANFYHIQDYALDGTIDSAAASTTRKPGDFSPPYLDDAELASNRSFRTTMVNWAYQILGLIKCQRETADYALSYFDRFLNCKQGSVALYDRPTFQLAFVSCLYCAVKLHETTAMPPDVFSKLSRGAYDEQEIQGMEKLILKSIDWRMNPPTALCFVREILGLISLADLPIEERLTVYDLAKAQIELVLSDYRFVSVKKSVLALAAVINALESFQHLPSFGWALVRRADMQDEDQEEICNVQGALCEEFSSQPCCIAGYSFAGSSSGSSFQDIEMGTCEEGTCNSPRSVSAAEVRSEGPIYAV